MSRTLLLLASLLLLPAAGACESKSCTSLGIVEEMTYETVLPQNVDLTTTTLEICFGEVCDTSRVVARTGSGERHCEDVDSRTPKFPTQCTFTAADRKLQLTTNTVYGGHAGSDPLVLTAIAPSGVRTELLRGTVRYEDVTDDAARGACTVAWRGTFTKG